MHSIKSNARRLAWGNDSPFNPVARRRNPSRRVDDAENQNQLELSSTAQTDQLPMTEWGRNGIIRHNIESADRAQTLPPENTSPRYTNHDDRIKSIATSDDVPTIATTSDSTENDKREIPSSHDLLPSNPTTYQSADDANAPRKRKVFQNPFKPKDASVISPELNHPTTNQSGRRGKFPKPSIGSQLRVVLFSWINLLLIFVPIGIALNYVNVDKKVVFVMNFLAIIPLAAMLSFSTEEIALYIGEVLGGLLNATFGNAVELIVSIIALVQGKVYIVQTSLIGSMLSNLLLVLGMCFFFGGINRVEQHFNITVAQTAASLLALAIGSLVIPTAYQIFVPGTGDDGVTPTSRGTAVLLLVTYGCYLLFQLRTHVDLYNEPSKKVPTTGPLARKADAAAANDTRHALAQLGANAATAAGGQAVKLEQQNEEEEEGETPQLTLIFALITLLVSTVFIALCAEYMVDSINELAKSVSQEFIGLILLPIVGNAAEHATSVTVAIKDKMDLSIGVAAGSSLQIALLVIPIMIMLNWWGVGSPADLNLDFDGFQVVVLFIAVILVNYVIQDGKSNWMEGVLLQVTYLIIAVAAWFYPASQDVAG